MFSNLSCLLLLHLGSRRQCRPISDVATPIGHFHAGFGVTVIISTASCGGVAIPKCPRRLECLSSAFLYVVERKVPISGIEVDTSVDAVSKQIVLPTFFLSGLSFFSCWSLRHICGTYCIPCNKEIVFVWYIMTNQNTLCIGTQVVQN